MLDKNLKKNIFSTVKPVNNGRKFCIPKVVVIHKFNCTGKKNLNFGGVDLPFKQNI